ncbi:hypothetical protein WN50_18325 [Limnoraphis robusta CS-951]|uniref:Uncharacterized protein n=1 Tax=Limnoraphis robusta CS-951 TaxID=1637645 RepID=A0A0F5YDK0_9CYAN|nr:hypothetical protein WN50_18325 [Limnoraphis robusta CS-951]
MKSDRPIPIGYLFNLDQDFVHIFTKPPPYVKMEAVFHREIVKLLSKQTQCVDLLNQTRLTFL